LLAYPKAQILSFDEERVHEIDYEQTGSFQVAHRFLNHREVFLEELFADTPWLFKED
jgi:predicted ATPase